MSNYANHVNTISEDILKKVCRKEFNALHQAVTAADVGFDTFADAIANETTFTDDNAVEEKVTALYADLKEAFRKATKLYLSLNYHDPEASERGDDVSGGFWEVGGVRDYTPAAKKFMKQYGQGSLTDSFFCTYG